MVLTRITGILKEPQVDAGALLNDALQRCSLPERIAVTIALESDPFLLQADLLQLRQVLVNVLTNAGQTIEGDGIITISAKTLTETGEAVISMTDSGPGIEADALERVFESLYTTRATGTGLGLAICKQIIKKHRGRITMTSEYGHCTTVTIVLPGESSAE